MFTVNVHNLNLQIYFQALAYNKSMMQTNTNMDAQGFFIDFLFLFLCVCVSICVGAQVKTDAVQSVEQH